MFGSNTNAYKNILYYSKAFELVNEKLDIVNLGSTIAYFDFDYSHIEMKGANWALPPQTLYYDYQILKQYSCYLKKGSVVCISLFYFSFMVLNYNKDRYYYKYYKILDTNSIIGFSKFKKLLWDNAPALVMPELFKRMLRDIPLISNEDTDFTSTDKKDKLQALQWMEGWKTQFNWNDEFKISDIQKKIMYDVTNILSEMIEFCNKNEFKPVLVIPPISINLKRLFPEKLIKECFEDNIANVISKKIKFLDYTNNMNLCQSKNFYDALCLNKHGKCLFNNLLVQDILKQF